MTKFLFEKKYHFFLGKPPNRCQLPAMTNATPTARPIFNEFTKFVCGLHYMSGGTFAAIKYLRTLGLPFQNARRLVRDFITHPLQEEVLTDFLPFAPVNPSLN